MDRESGSSFTVCCLCYGDYPHYAERLFRSLQSPAAAPYRFELRIGLNAVCDRTRDLSLQIQQDRQSRGLCTRIWDDDRTTIKYPRVRHLFYETPITTPWVMWFDDDCCISPSERPGWFYRVSQAARSADMLGWIFYDPLKPGQPEKIRASDWYGGKPVSVGHRTHFALGGWWVIRTAVLTKHNWPPEDMGHNGGDVMLGEMLRQQGYRMRDFRRGIWMSTDDTGKTFSAPRRGAKQPPYGSTTCDNSLLTALPT